jgi:phospholipid N-methyltransferase
MFRGYRTFFREFVRNFRSTGSIIPSSAALARCLARYVGKSHAPQRILEVGPGTGAVTRRIVAQMGPQDRLDLVELNDAFVQLLHQRFQTESPFQAVASRATILHQKVQDLDAPGTYDVIVSGLPLNNFDAADVRDILHALRRLLRPAGVLSFFEYIGVRRVRGMFSGRRQRQRLREIGAILHACLQDHEFRRDRVLWNLPPAWVHHVRFAADASPCEPSPGLQPPSPAGKG